MSEVIPIRDRRRAGHLTDPVDRRLSRLIARSMQVPGRHGFEVLFREFMQRGYEAVKQLPKADRR